MTRYGENTYQPAGARAGKHRTLVLIEIETWGADAGDACNRAWRNLGIGPGTYAEGSMPKFFNAHGPQHNDPDKHATTIRDLRPLHHVGFLPELPEEETDG